MCPICHCSIRQEVSHQAVAILQHITSKPPEMGAFSIYRLCDALLNRQGWYIGQDKGWISAFAESTSRLTQKGSGGNDRTSPERRRMYHPELMSSVSQRLLYLPAGLHTRPSQDVVIHLSVPIYGRAHDALVYRPLLCHRKLGCGLNHGRRYRGWSRDEGRNSPGPEVGLLRFVQIHGCVTNRLAVTILENVAMS